MWVSHAEFYVENTADFGLFFLQQLQEFTFGQNGGNKELLNQVPELWSQPGTDTVLDGWEDILRVQETLTAWIKCM